MNLLKGLRRNAKADDESRMLDPLTGYDRWAKQYANEANPVLQLEERLLLELLPNPSGKRVLDVGCGTGRVTNIIAEKGARQVIGIDFSRNMLAEACLNLRLHSSVTVLRSEAQQLPFVDAGFDLLTCSLMISHVREMPQFVRELSRVTQPRSHLLISEFHPYGHLLGWKRTFQKKQNGQIAEQEIDYHRYLHEDYFRAFKSAGLEVLELREACIDQSVKHLYDATSQGRQDYRRYRGYPLVLSFLLKKA